MPDGQPATVGRWQRRLLLATMPIGLAMIALWIAWAALALASGGIEAWWWGTPILGLVTSLILVVSGYLYRRDLARIDRSQ
jgi:membrane protein implicated in regulation of membrane protease activity